MPFSRFELKEALGSEATATAPHVGHELHKGRRGLAHVLHGGAVREDQQAPTEPQRIRGLLPLELTTCISPFYAMRSNDKS